MNYGPRIGSGLGNPPNKKEVSYIGKLSRQLTGVLVIILVLMLFKYTKTGIGENVNQFVKNNFYKDYSTVATKAFEKYSPEVKEVVETFVKNVEK
ncbi:hypothetical protein [Clostridium cylindrosporum]|uniref:Uncharacterized protein n=1 Tax=Clostridium cylindrosporum DSM 605 TaxID=1121307 RepID=A0A0J8G1C1_CLOCY|nr:hypothetical protein [Clostridium cylindrosporum]KMT21546.1 hypothetical protein CLCY_2c03080 [Clostridium cylindrosporum DSM 605]